MDDPVHLETSETTPWAVEPWTVQYVPETGSTQTDLLERAERGTLEHRTALRTDFQRTGRGRLDRRWGAPAGTNLLVSLAFTEIPADPGALMRRVGVAAVDAVASLISDPDRHLIGLKWPNDLLIDGRKAAGMLAQRSAAGAVVVGLGLNVGWAPDEGASISQLCAGPAPEPAAVLAVILERLDYLDHLDRSDPDGKGCQLADRYRARLITLGQRVRVDLGADAIEGVAVDIGAGGELIVRTEGGELRTLVVGDVKHLRALAPEER